ncbi:MAG: hypothetical protein ACI4N4_01765 [Candidatus Fimenecus sp.]
MSTTDSLRNTTTYGYSSTNSNDLRVHNTIRGRFSTQSGDGSLIDRN